MTVASSRRSNFILFTSLLLAAIFISLTQLQEDQIQPLLRIIKPSDDEKIEETFDEAANITKIQSYRDSIPTSLENTTSKYAYITLLAPDRSVETPKDYRDDVYFSCIRLLAYQLLHAKETRSEGIPFVVLTVPGVPEPHKERLRRDGAIVHEIEHLELPEWMSHSSAPNFARFADMFDKLRAWELTQFDRILFMDTDVILTQPIHPIFETVPTQHLIVEHSIQEREEAEDEEVLNDEEDLKNEEDLKEEQPAQLPIPPLDYVFAATHELNIDHHFPPTDAGGDFAVNDNYFNAGFFIMKPSADVFRYYMEMLAIPDSFPTDMMEQNFLNGIHSKDHNLPWKPIDPIWHIHWPTGGDIDAGVKSFHEKWWAPKNVETKAYFQSWKYRMDGFYEAWDTWTEET